MENQSQQNSAAPKQSPVGHDTQSPTPTQSLKERFSEGCIPTQQDFSDLIDMASVGYAAVGTQPDNSKKPGLGLELDGNQRLSVKIDNSASEGDMRGGLSVSSNGLSVAIDPSSGLQIDEEHRLKIDKDNLLSVNAFKQLCKDDRRAIYQLLLDSYNFDSGKRLVASDMGADDSLGISVAVSSDGRTLLIGAQNHNGDASWAYIFIKEAGEWKEKQKLTTSAGDVGGASVAISGDGKTLLVGSQNGSAYVFRKEEEEWKEKQRLDTNTSVASLAISENGETIIIGNNDRYRQMPAYVFTKEGDEWREKQRLTASNNDLCFGVRVAMSNNGQILLVGALESPDNKIVAYVFMKEGEEWKEKNRLIVEESVNGSGGGVAMSSNGEILIVGTINSKTGVAYVYMKNGDGWEEKQRLVTSTQQTYGDLDNNFAISGNGQTLLLGSCVFMKEGEEWKEKQILSFSNEFIRSVAVSGDGETLLVGEYKYGSGSEAYVYE
ncbi:hypothetical protein KPG66_12570 [Mycetohabitans sp. B2]|uniref:WD40 repeat domain-containing protein n=1 Tax=Mycetohabitans sp. B2 TaxID=2841274 RepID=UPI001F484191|nr:DUF5711 family protein [Mycetohabitans sp. B2]MCF7696894.1 hypothetical protein [Mycetohabitans sp. B2]